MQDILYLYWKTKLAQNWECNYWSCSMPPISDKVFVYPVFTTPSQPQSFHSFFSPFSPFFLSCCLCSLCNSVSHLNINRVVVSPGLLCTTSVCVECLVLPIIVPVPTVSLWAPYPGGGIHINTLRSVCDWLLVPPLLSNTHRHTGVIKDLDE